MHRMAKFQRGRDSAEASGESAEPLIVEASVKRDESERLLSTVLTDHSIS